MPVRDQRRIEWRRLIRAVYVCAGRSASETVLQQANRLSESYFSKQCAWAPAKQAAGVCLAYRVWRRPLYVAGRYLKLLRGVAQVSSAAHVCSMLVPGSLCAAKRYVDCQSGNCRVHIEMPRQYTVSVFVQACCLPACCVWATRGKADIACL